MANEFDPPGAPSPPSLNPTPVGFSLPQLTSNLTDETIYVQGVIIATSQADAGAAISVAGLNAQTGVYRAQADFRASVYSAAVSAQAHEYAADRQLEATNAQLAAQYSAQEYLIRQSDIDARKYAADQQRIGTEFAATTGAQADIQNTATRASADITVANTRAAADQAVALTDYQGKVFTAQANKDASVYGSNQDLAGRQYSADQSLAAQKYEADQQLAGTQFSQQQETARQQQKLSYADGKYADLFPFVRDSLQSQGIQTPGLDMDDWPYVSPAGALTTRQIQQQVNQALARNDSRTQAQILQAQTELAGRGFSSNSPLLEAIKTGYIGQNLRANNDAETQIRIQAAQANAEQTLKATELAVNEYQAKQETALKSESNQITRQVGLVGALAQLIGGVA